MTEQAVLDLGAQTIMTALKVASPALLAAMVAGLVISIFQAATQINEQTMSFIPKILAMAITMVVLGPWVLKVLINFTTKLFRGIPTLIH